MQKPRQEIVKSNKTNKYYDNIMNEHIAINLEENKIENYAEYNENHAFLNNEKMFIDIILSIRIEIL